jgi:hypothetical protein
VNPTAPQQNNSLGSSATIRAPVQLREMNGYEFTFQVQIPNDSQNVEHDDEEEAQLHREVLEILPEEDEDEEPEPIERSSGAYPFKDICTMILHSYLYGDDKVVSIKDAKKLLFTINLILNVYDKVENKEGFKLPAVDNILNYHQRKSNRVPIFPTKVEKLNVKIDGNDAVTECGLNLPSKHLEMLLANKKMSDKISALPDHTPNCSDSIQCGYKWRTHRLFQQPVRTIKEIDYWVGDVVKDKNNCFMLIHSYITMYGKPTIRFFNIEFPAENSGVIHSELNSIEECRFTDAVDEIIPKARYEECIFDSHVNGRSCGSLTDAHNELLFKDHFMKKQKNGTEKYYKVVIVPIIFFTDDTSGNQSKQYNLYDSFSFTIAALPGELREKRRNIFLVGAVSGSKGVTATSLSKILVTDLKGLELGKLMYSEQHGEVVRVYAPMCYIKADNARHAEMVGLYRLSSTRPCRKCYFYKPKRGSTERAAVLGDNTPRTREHYVIAAKPNVKDRVINLDGVGFRADTLKYKSTGTELFLELESFDPALDTPTELLHCIPLGVAKMLMEHLVRKLIKNDDALKRRVKEKLNQYRNAPGYTRCFGRKLEHVGSLIGRDFKFLLQVLPVLLNEFNDDGDNAVRALGKPFVKLGILSSMLFIRRVHKNLNNYIAAVNIAVTELIDSLVEYDEVAGTSFNTSPKVHALRHIAEDIDRHSCALNYETERDEQFNKFIRQYLHFTNLHNTSRDLGFKFGRYYMINHMLDGGSWVYNGTRHYVGEEIVQFMEDNPNFRESFLGDCDIFSDNNSPNCKIKEGFSAVFSLIQDDENRQFFVGKVAKRENNLCVIQYDFAGRNSDGHILATATDVVHMASDCKTECVLDMHRPSSNNNQLINVCKFGTYWFLLDTPIVQSNGSSIYLLAIN